MRESLKKKGAVVPVNLKCPLSKEIFYEPVKMEDGLTYEKEWILAYLSIKQVSPMTGAEVKSTEVKEDMIVQELRNEFLKNLDIKG